MAHDLRLVALGSLIGAAALAACQVRSCGAPGSAQNREVVPRAALPTEPLETSGATLSVRVLARRSSSVDLHWSRVAGATAVRILLGPEPPDRPGDALPLAVEIARPAPSAIAYRVEHLAPGADAFLRVEVTSPAGTSAANVHARTPGGPRVALETDVREVHLVGPDVLQVVLAGGDGGEWAAAGQWVVERRNGRRIAVRAVNRHSVPVRQPGYEVGYQSRVDLEPIDVDHRIYLRLGEAVGEREVLRVRGPHDLRFVLPFSDRFLETPVVQLNQVGYNPRATRRWAYVSAWLGDGGPLRLLGFPSEAEVLREPGNELAPRHDVVARVRVRPRAQRDRDAGTDVEEMDLSSVPAAEGVTYRIRLPGIGVSFPTQVSERAALKAYWVVTRGLFLNRWAGDLRADCTEWTRPADHTTVFTAEQANAFEMFPESTPHTGARPLRGGYHDAGDFDQRPSHTVVAQLLMRAYELAPDRFPDRQLAIPESGNGIPDLLDEALWGVAGWEALQERDGGVRGGVESYRHPDGIHLAHEDGLPYWTFARNADVTARAAGLFAQASRLVARFDARRAAALRDRAVRAFRWARAHRAAPTFLLYGASELARLTGERQYVDAFRSLFASLGGNPFARFSNSQLGMSDYAQDRRAMPDFVLGYGTSPSVDPAFRTELVRFLDAAANEAAERMLDSTLGHRSARPPGYPLGWGQGVVQGRYLDPIIARLALGVSDPDVRQRYFDALSVGADFVLGANPEGIVWITGLGSRHPEEPLHNDSLVWVKRGRPPVPGIPVYGPVNDLPGAPWYRPGEAAFHPPFAEHPPMRRYGDIRTFVNTSEFTVWETQAPHAEHFAALLGPGQTPPRSWLAGQPDHASPLP